jgi:hypothetical protein
MSAYLICPYITPMGYRFYLTNIANGGKIICTNEGVISNAIFGVNLKSTNLQALRAFHIHMKC